MTAAGVTKRGRTSHNATPIMYPDQSKLTHSARRNGG